MIKRVSFWTWIILYLCRGFAIETHHVSNLTDLYSAMGHADHGDHVWFDAGTYRISTKLLIRKNLTLWGQGEATVIEGIGNDRLIEIEPGLIVSMNHMVFSNGRALDGTSLAPDGEDGGGFYVHNGANLSLNDCYILNCHAGDGFNRANGSDGGRGGALHIIGYANLRRCILRRNRSGQAVPSNSASVERHSGFGGAIHVTSGGGLRVEDSWLDDNQAAGASAGIGSMVAGHGGAIYNGGTADILRTCFSANRAGVADSVGDISGMGGAVFSRNSMELAACSFANNYAENQGGALRFESNGRARVFACSLDGNQALRGAAISSANTGVELFNTAIGPNQSGLGAAFSVEGSFDYANHCVIANRSGATFNSVWKLTESDPLLQVMGPVGGISPGLRPGIGSPCLDAGAGPDDSRFQSSKTDQRGFPRKHGSMATDVGSLEIDAWEASDDTGERNDHWRLATDLGNLSLSHSLGRTETIDINGEDEDWFVFDAVQAGVMTVRLHHDTDGGANDIDLELFRYPEHGNANRRALSNQTTGDELIYRCVHEGERVYVRVYSFQGGAGYALNIDLGQLELTDIAPPRGFFTGTVSWKDPGFPLGVSLVGGNQLERGVQFSQMPLGYLRREAVGATPSWGFIDPAPHMANPLFVRLLGDDTTALPGDGSMRIIPGGYFIQGDGQAVVGQNERIPTSIIWVSGFLMEEAEVTRALWDQVVNDIALRGIAYDFDNISRGNLPDQPITSVSWIDCVRWCNARSELAGLSPVYLLEQPGLAPPIVFRTTVPEPDQILVRDTANGFRLPTHAEWEKAARGGLTGHHYPWPSAGGPLATFNSSQVAMRDISDPSTDVLRPVKSFAPNGYGLYDMAGNAEEWVYDGNDGFGGSFSVNRMRGSDPSSRIVKGGHFRDDGDVQAFRCAARRSKMHYEWVNHRGFRCARGSVDVRTP